ncbi:hypothetical protein AC1031_003573 [Aphanomyces cochlioides]|nr:hypothetical protein AC1031_003573 [Aphanomyces cochlioides]
MATTKTARQLASTPALQRLPELRVIEDVQARRELTAQVHEILLAEWKQDRRWRGGAHHLIDDVHSWFRQGFATLAEQAKSRQSVDVAAFQQWNRMLHHHHGYEDRMWFPHLEHLHPESHDEIEILEKDHRKLVELETRIAGGDYEALIEFVEHLMDHLNREEMLSVPWLLEGTGGL